VDLDGRQHYMLKVATITRYDGVGNIAAGDVTDERPQIILPSVAGVLSYTCSALVSVGDWVYPTGPNSVDRAQADNIATSRPIGFVASKMTPTTCLVAVAGQAPGSGLTPSSEVFLSDSVPGGVTSTAPTTPGNYIVPLGVADSTTTFVIKPGEIEEA
jgi:hypothetical protein